MNENTVEVYRHNYFILKKTLLANTIVERDSQSRNEDAFSFRYFFSKFIIVMENFATTLPFR